MLTPQNDQTHSNNSSAIAKMKLTDKMKDKMKFKDKTERPNGFDAGN